MPSGKKRKGHKMATHKRKKRLRKNRHKKKLKFSLKIKFHDFYRKNKRDFFSRESSVCSCVF